MAGGTVGRFQSNYARRMARIEAVRCLGGRISPLYFIGVHDIDEMLWYKSQAVTSVAAREVLGRVREKLGAYELAWVTMEIAAGAVGVVEVGCCLPEKWGGWTGRAGCGGFGEVRSE